MFALADGTILLFMCALVDFLNKESLNFGENFAEVEITLENEYEVGHVVNISGHSNG